MFNIIVAHSINNGIGYLGKIPWNISDDLKYFHRITTKSIDNKKNILIMGKNTWNSLQNKPLKDRHNFILARDIVNNNIDINILLNNLERNNNINDIFVIGGENVYKQFINDIRCKYIYVTLVNKIYKCDAYFPQIPNWFTTKHVHSYYYRESNQLIKINNIVYKNDLYDENSEENNYLKLVSKILNNGAKKECRSGYVYSLFGESIEFDLSKGFPLLTTKKMFYKGIIEELLFFLRGETDTKLLEEKGVNIWKNNTMHTNGLMGPMYGFVWRHYGKEYLTNKFRTPSKTNHIDQLKNLIISLNTNINNRRHIMTTYNPLYNDMSVLYPCHGIVTQFDITNKKLNCCMYQRSADVGLGLPFNIASYSLLMHIIRLSLKNTYDMGTLKIFIGDAHIYEEHLKDIKIQSKRTPFRFPDIKINKKIYDDDIDVLLKNIENLCVDNFELINYNHHDSIKLLLK